MTAQQLNQIADILSSPRPISDRRRQRAANQLRSLAGQLEQLAKDQESEPYIACARETLTAGTLECTRRRGHAGDCSPFRDDL